jgi:uncharacterized protein YhaN
MRITALEVDGFGVWSGLKLGEMVGGLNVFFGPNEAGKTTLMQFMRSVLYGFSPQRRRYLPPQHGGRPGGSLAVQASHGQFLVSRFDNPADPQAEILSLVGADGSRHGEQLLESLLAGVDEAIFNNVFSVGLRELQELGTLSDTDAAALLYSLSIGLDRVSLVEVMHELNGSRDRILDRSGGPCQIAQLLAERDKLRAEIAELGTLNRRYARLAAERGQIDRQSGRLQEEQRQLEQQSRLIGIALAQRPRWQTRVLLDEQLAVIGPPESMPEGAVERLAGLNNRLGEHRQKVDELGRLMARLQAESDGLSINEAVVQLAPRIEALREQETWIGTLEKGVGESEGEIARLEAQIKVQQQQLGLAEQAHGDGLRAVTSQTLASLREPALAFRRCRRRLEKIKQESGIGQQHDRTLADKIEEALRARGEKDLSEAVEHGGLLVAQLRRRVQLDERVEQMEHYQTEMGHQSRRLLEHQLLPVWMLAGLGGVFVIGVVLLMAGLLIPGSIAEVGGWCLALLGLSATICSVATKFLLERTNAKRLETCQKQLHALQSQLKQVSEERATLDEQLPAGSGTAASRLATAEKELAALEELVPLDSQRKSMKQAADEASQRVRHAEASLSAAERRWQEALSKAGLPPALPPKQVRTLIGRGEEINDLQRRLEARYEECQQRSRELEAICGRIRQLAAETNVKLSSSHASEQIREMVRRLEEQQSLLKRRDALGAEIRQLRRKKIKHGKAIARWTRDRRELLHAAGVETEEQFRARAAELARVEGLKQQRLSIQREIDAAIAGHCDLETLRGYLEGPAEESLEARRHQVQERLSAAEAQLREQFEQRGRLGEQIKVLAHDRQPAEKQLALGMVEQRIRESIRTWQVRAVTSQVLESIRKTYEKERQPETLQEASGYLERMTEGRYGRIWTPLDEKVLLVDDAAGRPLPIEVLSQGTREQLFLALRLALVSSYARRGAVLPMILDDVLVNFDTQRARAAAEVLCDFAAADHQLLVFTCHEHILQLFKLLDAEVTELPPSGEEPARLAVHKPTAAARRPKRKVQPESEPPVSVPGLGATADSSGSADDAKTRRRGDTETRGRGDAETRRLGATAGLSGSAEGSAGESKRGSPPAPKHLSRPVRPAAEEEHRRRGRLVPWNAPWGEERPKEQPSVFVNERNEMEYVDSDVEPVDYTHQPTDDAAGSDDDSFQDDEEEGGFDPDDDADFGRDFDHGYEDEQGYLDARGDAEAA